MTTSLIKNKAFTDLVGHNYESLLENLVPGPPKQIDTEPNDRNLFRESQALYIPLAQIRVSYGQYDDIVVQIDAEAVLAKVLQVHAVLQEGHEGIPFG